MKADYFRYLSEFQCTGDNKEIYGSKAADSALETYTEASEIADSELASTHPIRLGLALNFSVFYYEVLNSHEKACQLAKTAFDSAIAELDNVDEEYYKDSTTIM
mmetsp:Transcript_26484/g.12455  ORF Transcript_26484/g.12455 Transcript_26484/m.12455 type:complete len:104 (+) Transcript_26484:326-637(+)